MQALIKDNVVFCKMCEVHNYKILDYKTVEIKGKSHTKFIARCICGTEFYFFSKITIDSEKHYVIDEEIAESEEKVEMKTGQWMYQLGNGDIWDGEYYETKEEAINEGVKEKGKSNEKLRIGQIEKVQAVGVDVDFILENVAENTTSELGEVGEDYLQYVEKEHQEELEEKLNQVLFTWMKEHKYEPDFFLIVNEEEINE